MRLTDASWTCSIASIGAAIGVHTNVGAIALTLMWWGAQSIDRLRVSAATDPLVAVYADWLGSDRTAACEARFTMRPPPRPIIWRAAACAAKNVPFTLT